MARPSQLPPLWSQAEPLLFNGPVSARQLASSLSVSQPTISRLLTLHRNQVLVVGQARSTRYVARRPIADVGPALPVFEVDDAGHTRKLAVLHGTGTRGFYVEPQCNDVDARLHDGLPYFLDGLRPAGFLGRLLPRQHPALGLPADIRHWSPDQTVRYLALVGWNAVGSLIVGERAFEQYLAHALEPQEVIDDAACGVRYEQLAHDVLAGAPPGSSAAGEQPKFLTLRTPRRHVLVKFSPPRSDAAARRWADMLVAECLALETLRSFGQSSAHARLVDGRDRVFLEVDRFDRTDRGRRGVIPLEALDAEFAGTVTVGTWSASVDELVRVGVVSPQATTRVRWLSVFGALIGNTDMHLGNLSFLTRGARVVQLAPAYDMLPMLYAPHQGHLPERSLAPPPPKALDALAWEEACVAACAFWHQTAEHPLVSSPFRSIARTNVGVVERMRALSAHLPR